jgi:iron complex transport system ATP-binding protein
VDWALEVTGTSHLAKKSIRACSGGEQQRVWIAMVLAQQPEILFLDEPTTYLDISHQQETMRLVKRLKRESGIGIVMVLHDLSHALEVSDHIVVIKDGKKYSEGTPLEVITPKMLREVYNVECQVVKIPGRHYPLLAYQEIS